MVVVVTLALIGTTKEPGVGEGGSVSVICDTILLKGPRPTAVPAATLMRYVVFGEIPIVRAVEVGEGGRSTTHSSWAPPSTSKQTS